MNTHPYVRGYMAGIVVPTLFLLLVMSAYFVLRIVMEVPVPIERAIAFPMAVVPNLWGVWNMLHVRMREGRHLPIGVHGSLLVLVIAPLVVLAGSALHFVSASGRTLTYFGQIRIDYVSLAIGVGVVMVIYYLVWKYIVNFLNELLGIA